MKQLRFAFLVVFSLISLSLHAATLPSDTDIQQKAKHYYDTRGEWAGTFVIQRFMRQRIADQSDSRFVAHLEYVWAFKQDPTRTGTDERTFTFERRDNQWQVIDMGGNHSGKF